MAAAPSTNFFSLGDEDRNSQNKLKQSSTPTSSAVATSTPQKKKRNLPGTPNPDAEVIALSPKTLMATNRFICEVCNKGFQREQNLQLHRRGHNLPWKLRQKTTKEVRRRVYLCPEPTCVHHDPSRALGDLTGIKKHFCRKHGEKKWKCDKCSKRYAVQSDWKAHSKTCGTREYRCDCGTLFSRRDSFITHRAFCDALAQESARLPTGLNTLGGQLYGSSNMGLGLSQGASQIGSLPDPNPPSADILRLGGAGGAQFDHLIASSNSPFRQPPAALTASSSAYYISGSNQDFHEESQTHHGLLQSKPFNGLMQLPDLSNNSSNSANAAAASLFNLGFFSNSTNSSSMNNNNNNNNNNNSGANNNGLLLHDQFNNGSGSEPTTLYPGNVMGDHMSASVSSLYNNQVQNDSVIPQMSATALLQKAAQMGATTSSNSATLLRGFGNSSTNGGAKAERTQMPPTFPMKNLPNLEQMRANFSGSGGESLRSQLENETHLQDLMNSLTNGGSSIFGGGSGANLHATFGGNCTSGGSDQDNSFGGFSANRVSMDHHQHHRHQNPNIMEPVEVKLHQNFAGSMGGSDRLTRDFLGVGGMVRSMGGGISQREQHQNLEVSSLNPDIKSAAARSFSGGNLQ